MSENPEADPKPTPAPAGAVIEDGGTDRLGARTAQGAAITMLSQLAQNLIHLGLLAVLARILTPADYGLMGMIYTLTALLVIFSDLGFSSATVQKDGLTHAQLSNLFWANLSFGLLLTLITAAVAPLLAWFYNNKILLPVTLWYAPNFFLGALGVQHRALLRRRMGFLRLALCDILGMALGGGLAIMMARRGMGVYALVGQALTMAAVSSLMAWVLCPFLPSLPRRRQGTLELVKFGGYLTGFFFFNYFSRNMDKMLLGKFWSPSEVGLYTRAYSLMTYPTTLLADPMRRVMVPALSRLQNEGQRFEEASLKALRVLALLSFPISGGLAALGEEVILIVFGQDWKGAIPIFQVLCLSGIFTAWGSSMGWFYIARGKTREMMKWGSVSAPIVVASFLPCIWYAGMGAAVGYALVLTLIILPAGFWYMARSVNLRLTPILLTALGPLVATATMIAAIYLTRHYFLAEHPVILRTAIMVPEGALVFFLAMAVVGRRSLSEALTALRNLIEFRRSRAENADR